VHKLIFIFLVISSLYVASQRLYITSNDNAIIGYELQYAMDHIQKSAMQAIGDKNNAPIEISTDGLVLTIRHIDKADPDDSPTYSDYTDDKEITYTIKSDGGLAYRKVKLPGGSVLEDEDMIPRVTLLSGDNPVDGDKFSKFYMDGNVLKVKLTAEFPLPRDGKKERLTLYSAVYPRLATFH